MSPLICALVLISLRGSCLALAVPHFPGFAQVPRSYLQCENVSTKRWRHDFDIEVQKCRTRNGDELVKPEEISDEDKDEIIKLYPGLLLSDDDISRVPLSQGVDVVPLELSPHSGLPAAGNFPQGLGGPGGLPTSAGFPQGFVGPGIQTIGLTPNVAAQQVPSRASAVRGPPMAAAAASTRAAGSSAIGCCSVTRKWSRPTVLENINGVLRSIVHFPSRSVYQYINEGSCRYPGSACANGQCYTEQATRYLAVFLPEVGENVIGFEAFSVDNHCVCLNIGK